MNAAARVGMLRVRVLGGFALEESAGAAAPALSQRRAEAVLAVLAVCGDLGCTRDRLIALLWPESDESRSRHGLRNALHAIRQALGPDAVLSAGDVLRLDPTLIVSDVVVFAHAVTAGRHAEAARTYVGPLLDGFHVDAAPEFERWLDGERGRLAREFAESLESLATTAERAGDWDEAAGWWARAVEHDPLNSHLVLQQVRALVTLGDRANAIKLSDAHARRLREELDLEPDRTVLANIERMRRDELPTPPTAGGVRAPPWPGAGPDAADAGTEPLRPPAARIAVATPTLAPSGFVARLPRWVRWSAGLAVLALMGAAGLKLWLSTRPVEPEHPRTAIAVLPFQNLSADTAQAYFASGLHDELETQLGRVAALTVIGSGSAGDHRQSTTPLRQIGEELGVGSIVEGSVQVLDGRLRVIVQLIDPVTEAHLWAEHYDAMLSDAFAVQSDIARRIVERVGAALTGTEAGAIATPPTQDPEAYDLYLQGLEYDRRPGRFPDNLAAAQQLYERALARDSTFALAHAALSSVLLSRYTFEHGRPRVDLERARREAAVALRLAPGLPQAHLAAGQVRYTADDDSRGALDEFERGVHGAPNDADLWGWVGRANLGLGHWDSAVVALERALKLDPRNPNRLHILGDVYHYLHRFRKAILTYRREIALAPDVAQARLSMAWSYVLWKGDLDTLRSAIRASRLDAAPGMGGPPVGSNLLLLALMERRPDSVLAILRRKGLERDPNLQVNFVAPAHLLRGDTAAARATYEVAAESLAARMRAHPGDPGTHGVLGIALAARLAGSPSRRRTASIRTSRPRARRSWPESAKLLRPSPTSSGRWRDRLSQPLHCFVSTQVGPPSSRMPASKRYW
jgi:TolB-like protein/DNA-binding SARP family transcriptional activator/Flp pilus assembly protein TadD